MKKIIIGAIIVAAIAVGGFFLLRQDSQPVQRNDFAFVPSGDQLLNNMQEAGLPALQAEGSVMHIHQHLDINVNGQDQSIPSEIGVATSFISPIHTHDGTGVIHVESPEQKDFKLGQFFTEWGVKLDQNCVGSYCVDDAHKLVVAVNDNPVSGNPADYVLKEKDEIYIWYGPKDQTPVLKYSYQFSEGL